jgi:hypothetical protein
MKKQIERKSYVVIIAGKELYYVCLNALVKGTLPQASKIVDRVLSGEYTLIAKRKTTVEFAKGTWYSLDGILMRTHAIGKTTPSMARMVTLSGNTLKRWNEMVCSWHKGTEEVKAEKTNGLFYMAKGTIGQARDTGSSVYKKHSNPKCWTLKQAGEIILLNSVDHSDLISSERVIECAICSGTFRKNVTPHIKPTSLKHQKPVDVEVKHDEKQGLTRVDILKAIAQHHLDIAVLLEELAKL